jgi:small-conductance mechanosensitive channel
MPATPPARPSPVYGPSPMGKVLHDLPLLPIVALYTLVALLGAVVTRNAVRRALDRAVGRMDPQLHRVMSRSLPRPAGLAVFLLIGSMALRFLPLPAHVERLTEHDLPFALGTLGIVVLMRVALNGVSAYAETSSQLKSTAGMARAITWIVGLSLIAAVVSDALGISLAPALTALGVGSLSVALALQDTLTNFFAGVYLLLDKPIRPGDFVRIDGGNEGYVETIGWRSTHLRTLAPSLIIVPNATLSKSVITNFKQINPRLVLATPIDVPLDVDPDKVAAILGEEAKSATDLPGVDAGQPPFVRFAIGDRGLTFTLYVAVTPAADGGLVQQELRMRAIRRLRKDGVKLAEPNPFAKKA